jgi:RNA polymerase sigma-70 factor (ECF subfamily)
MGDDLELARRALSNEATALEELDRRIATEAGRVGSTWGIAADELRQALRERVLVAEPGQAPRLSLYDGTGPLAAWLRTVAVRVSSNLKRMAPREDLVSSVPEVALVSPDPELALLRLRHRAHFREAFGEAVRALDATERTVLRLHAIDGLSLASIGTMFQRDASSVSRWLSRIRAKLLVGTRGALARHLKLEGSELDSLMRLADSELTVSLSTLLA